MQGTLIALGLLAAYIAFVVWLVQSGRLQKWNLSLMLGIVLMVRTQRRRSKPPRKSTHNDKAFPSSDGFRGD